MLAAEYLTSAEVAKLLRLKRETIQGYVRDGKLSAIKVGRNFLFTRESVSAYLAEGTKVRSVSASSSH